MLTGPEKFRPGIPGFAEFADVIVAFSSLQNLAIREAGLSTTRRNLFVSCPPEAQRSVASSSFTEIQHST